MPNPPITINTATERAPIENLDFIEVNCGEESKEIVETGYSVIFPLQEGVKPGSKESQLIPACGGATIKFYPESNFHGSIGKKISEKISSQITGLNDEIENIVVNEISSLVDTYSSKLLKAKLSLQKILFESSRSISDDLPDISFQFVTSLNNLWKEEEKLETYKDFQDLLAKESDAYFDSLGKFNFLSKDTILKILEIFIPGSYYKSDNKYYSIIKTNSGISLYSLYRYIAIYSGVEESNLKHSEYLNGIDFGNYSANSDAKKYIDTSSDYEWNTSAEAPPLDFLIREFFDFFIPYIKVSEFGSDQQNNCCGFFTFFDFPSEDGVSQSIGYLKTPDFSFEDANGEVNSDGEISFGYNKNENSGLFEDAPSSKKQFLSLYLDLKDFGSKRVLPAKYLPKPIIRLSGDINDDGTYSASIDNSGNIKVRLDVSDILGGEFEAFGLERAPKESDYLLKTSLSSGVPGEFQNFYFMNSNVSKIMNLTDLQHFSYPNILGGLALDSSLDITINDQELKKENFLSGNFNIAFIEDLSRMEASPDTENNKGQIREKMEEAFIDWDKGQISEVSTKEYVEGEDSGFYNASIPESQGLSNDMTKSFGSYRSYLISNGIPNNLKFANIFGFEDLQDYLNFKGDVHNLILSNSSYEKKEAQNKNKILEKNKFLESEDGILFCRPRIVDNSSNIIGDHLSDTLFSSIELENGTLPDNANDILYKIKRNDISLENITSKNKDIYITFQIIDSLGQFTRVNGSVKIKKTSDLSTASETSQFSTDGVNPSSPIKIPLIFNGESSLENETVTVTLYTTASDGGLGSVIGSTEASLTVTGIDTAEITTTLLSNWIDEFSISEDTVGNFKLVASNSFSETPPMDLNVNQNGISNVVKEKEFRISNKRVADIPVSIYGDLPEIKIKSKSKLFGKGKDTRFYFAAIVNNETEKEDALKAFSKFSLLQDIYVIKFDKKEAVISKDFYLSEEDGRLSDPGNNKLMSFQFPPKKYSRRNIKELSNLTGIEFSIIGTLGPISFGSEPPEQPASDYNDYLYYDLIPDYLKNKVVDLKDRFYSITAEGISLQKTPDILEMCFLKDNGAVIRTVKELAYLSNFELREGIFNQDLLSKIKSSKPLSNLDEGDKKGNLVIAIDGSYYNPKDLFVYTRDEFGSLKEIDGKLKKNEDYIYLDESKNKTYIFIKKFKVPKSTEFSIEVFYKDKKLNSLISSSNSKIDSYFIKGEEFSSSEDKSKIILKKKLDINLKKEKYRFISEEIVREIFYISIPDPLYYKVRSDYEAFGSSLLNGSLKEISIFDESNSGFKIPQIEDLNINFPPSIGDIFNAFKPKISIESDGEGGSFSVSVTNPIDLYSKANSLGSLEKIDLVSESESPKYASSKYIKEISEIYLKEGQEILSEYFQLGDNQAIVHIPLSIVGPERITVGQVTVDSIDTGNGEVFTSEDGFSGLVMDGSQNSVFKFTMSGILPAGSGIQFNGYELSGTSTIVDGRTVFSVPVNEDTFKEANIASNLIEATGFKPVAVGPCPDYIGVTDTGSEIRESEKDPALFSKGNEEVVDDETYYGIDAVDSDTIMSDVELEKMEIGYGKSLIRKPLSGTAEAIRSLCDLSFHMTSEFRAQLRGFQNILVIIKVIFCIIDVICALGNPAKLGRAILRLFICLTDLLQLLPQVAIPLAFLKLLSHSINLGTCLITKLLRTYSALSEIASAIDEAIILKDYAALTRLEKTLNKHIITINADISVLDPILDIIDIFKEMLELAFLFPCSNDADEKLFNACGSDNSVCSIVIGTLIKNNSLNVESLFPVVQSYTTIGTENLTVDSSGAATVNCGNTPPDDLISNSRRDLCFGSDSSNEIFVEPRLESDTLPIIDISDFGESDYSIEKLRTTSGDIESSFSASFTRSKRPALTTSTIVSADLRKCTFEFNYKGITNKLAFDNFLYWLFPNRTIDINKTSDSPIIPMKKSGNSLYLDKDFSNGITLYNPSTGGEVSLKGNETDGFTVPSLTISYLDENGTERTTDESEYSVPSIVLVDESLAVYKIDKIYVNSDSSSDEFGIYKIDATRADYPSFDAKKFSKEDEQYISDPKIYYANANYLALKSFFSSGDYGDSVLFKTDNVSGTPPEVTDDSIGIMESIIFLFHEDGTDLYGEYGIINTDTALNSKVISSSSNHVVSANGTGSFDFKGGAVFKKVFDELVAQGSTLTWLVEGSSDFNDARDAYLELFESQTLLENFGSFPYTEYVHKDQTFRDPTQAYLNAYTSSIGTASVYDFPTLYFFDMNTVMEDLIDMCNNNNNLVDDDGIDDLKLALDSFLNCCSKPKKNLEDRVNLMKERLSKGQTISDLPFLSEPRTGPRDIVELVECSRDIAKSICSLAISYTASEFLLLENAYGSSSTIYYSGSADESSPLLQDDGVALQDLVDEGFDIGAAKHSLGIGDFGEYFVDTVIPVRVVLRASNGESIGRENLEFESSIRINIIEDTGGQLIIDEENGVQFNLVRVEDDNQNQIFAYEATMRSSVPTEVIISCTACSKNIKSYIDSSIKSQLERDIESCNDSIIQEQIEAIAFGGQETVDRTLSLSITSKPEAIILQESDSGSFKSKNQPQIFGSQE